MTLRLEGALYRPLGPQTEPPMRAHDIVCAHTMVGYLLSTDSMFHENGYGGTESHLGIGGAWGSDADQDLDGAVWQWQDMMFQADANGPDGNWHVLSIETADNNPKSSKNIKRWTPAQADSLTAAIAQMCSLAFHRGCPRTWDCRQGVVWRGIEVAIPPVLIPDTRPGRRGLAVHRQGVKHSRGFGVPGYLEEGGERWSISDGKECPGDVRVEQFQTEIIPAVQRLMLQAARPQETEMALDKNDVIRLGPSAARVLNQSDNQITLEEAIGILASSQVHGTQILNTIATQNQQLLEQGAQILQALKDLKPATPPV
jgi:hypothetical protein